MKAIQIIKKTMYCCAGMLTAIHGINSYAVETGLFGTELTEEQSQLLNGQPPYSAPEFSANFNNKDAFGINPSTIPLVSFSLTASTNSMKGNALEFDAMYQSWSINNGFDGLHYKTMETSLTLEAPLHKALDFSQSIREKVEAACAEKLLDRMLVDGALGFNINW